MDAVHVFGFDLNYKLNDAIKLNGGYSQSNIYQGSKSVVTRDNLPWQL